MAAEIRINAEGTVASMKDLRKVIKDAKDEIIRAQAAGEDYSEALERAANATRDLDDMQKLVKNSAADMGQKLSNIASLGTSIAGGFAAAQGAMALFGGESKALEEVQTKLQASIALVQGLSKFENITKVLKNLKGNFTGLLAPIKSVIAGLQGVKGAIVGTGIGALVVALGLLIANWDKLSAALKKFIGISDDAGVSADSLKDKYEKLDSELDHQSALYAVNHSSLETAIYDMQNLEDAMESAKQDILNIDRELEECDFWDWLTGRKRKLKDAKKAAEERVTELGKAQDAAAKKVELEQAKERKKAEDEKKRAAAQARAEEKRAYETHLKEIEAITLKDYRGTYLEAQKDFANRLQLLKSELDKRKITIQDYNKEVKKLNKKQEEVLKETAGKSLADLTEWYKKETYTANQQLDDGLKTSLDEIDGFYQSIETMANNHQILPSGEIFDATALQYYSGMLNDLKASLIKNTNKQKEANDLVEFLKNLEEALDSVKPSIDGYKRIMEDTFNSENTVFEKAVAGKKGFFDYYNAWRDTAQETIDMALDQENRYSEGLIAKLEERKAAVEKLNANSSDEIARKEQEIANLQAQIEDEKLRHKLECDKLDIESEEQKAARKKAILNGSLSVAASIFGALSGFYEQGTEEYRALASTEAMINALSSANAAYSAMAGIPYVGPALGAAAAAAALAAGVANVIQINKADKNTTSGGSVAQVPAVQNIEPYQYTRNLMTSDEQAAINNDRPIYVTVTDIEDGLNAQRAKVAESTF